MPQLWTETFISQYFWLLLILLTFYYFIATKVIPIIAEAIKARQVTDSSEKQLESSPIKDGNDKSIKLFSLTSKQDYEIKLTAPNWEMIQTEWLSTNPENDNIYWVEANLTEESKVQLEVEEDSELTLDEFLQTEENPA